MGSERRGMGLDDVSFSLLSLEVDELQLIFPPSGLLGFREVAAPAFELYCSERNDDLVVSMICFLSCKSVFLDFLGDDLWEERRVAFEALSFSFTI